MKGYCYFELHFRSGCYNHITCQVWLDAEATMNCTNAFDYYASIPYLLPGLTILRALAYSRSIFENSV